MGTTDDRTLAAMAVGFSLGFGFLTTWEAIKQTRSNRNPLRSVYILMVWGELASNVCIMVLSWLLLDGTVGPTLPVLWWILFFWTFETQLQPQIVINRVAIISESQAVVRWVKWGTALFVALVNVSVFVIWIPSHVSPEPPGVQEWIRINMYYDRVTKVFFLLIDAGLNWWFVRVVERRLVKQHRLTKYKPLVAFNSRMMLVAVLMDVMLTALLSLPNELVYIQFHPVAYLVKLKIELSMASLITRLARGQGADANPSSLSYSYGGGTGNMLSNNHHHHKNNSTQKAISRAGDEEVALKAMKSESRAQRQAIMEEELDDIHPKEREAGVGPPGVCRRIDIDVTVHSTSSVKGQKNRGSGDDEMSLTDHACHPLPPPGCTVASYPGSRTRRKSLPLLGYAS